MINYHLPYILLVEDDPDDIELFKQALATVSPKSNLLVGESCNDAFPLLENNSVIPDLIFMDLGMHEVDGFDCIIRIKDHTEFRNIPIVVLSTFITPALLERLYDLGVSYFITKPTTFKKLQDAINKMVNSPSIFKEQTKDNFHCKDFD